MAAITAAASKRFSVKLLRLKELEGGAERLTAEVERLRPLEQRCAELEAAAAAARHSVRSSALCRGVPCLTLVCMCATVRVSPFHDSARAPAAPPFTLRMPFRFALAYSLARCGRELHEWRR